MVEWSADYRLMVVQIHLEVPEYNGGHHVMVSIRDCDSLRMGSSPIDHPRTIPR